MQNELFSECLSWCETRHYLRNMLITSYDSRVIGECYSFWFGVYSCRKVMYVYIEKAEQQKDSV
jgi:hypothetical protein